MGQRAILGQLSSLDPAAARRGEAAVPWTQFSIDVLLTVATLPIGGEAAEAAAGMRALSGEMKVASMGIREVGAAERVFAREEVGVFAKEGAAEVGMVARETGVVVRELEGGTSTLVRSGESVLGRDVTAAGRAAEEASALGRAAEGRGRIPLQMVEDGSTTSCFAPEMKMRTPDGSKSIIEFKARRPDSLCTGMGRDGAAIG